MKKLFVVSVVVVIGLVSWLGVWFIQHIDLKPVLLPPPDDITDVINTTGMPLVLPPGFSIEIFADELTQARVMAFDSQGNMWVSRTREGVITLLTIEGGQVVAQNDIFRDLNNPHGLALDPYDPFLMYIAEEDKVSRVQINSQGPLEKLFDLPSGGGHFTRTLGFGADGALYVTVGSSCNVCHEEDERRATILRYDTDTDKLTTFARGLRNAVFFTLNPVDGRIWATEMGRDLLGDDIPPDEINIIEQDSNYGWPICYGKSTHDQVFDKRVYFRAPCQEPLEVGSHIDIPAHSAPLGLAFVEEEAFWPDEYWLDLLVAYHGSWNRSVPTGYKVVRMRLDDRGNHLGTEDFIKGWLQDDGFALGRPVDVKFGPGRALYISDDKAGVIYRVDYSG
jgi:glucose/arabinose dehydrogenase